MEGCSQRHRPRKHAGLDLTGLLRAFLAHALRRTASAIAAPLSALADRLDPPRRNPAGEGDPRAQMPP